MQLIISTCYLAKRNYICHRERKKWASYNTARYAFEIWLGGNTFTFTPAFPEVTYYALNIKIYLICPE